MLSNSKRLFLAVLLVFSVVLAVAVGFFLIDYIEEKNAMTDGGVNVDLTEELNAIYIDGELYLPRKGVENYLIIGVDKAGESDSDQIGQADFLMVLSFDSNDGTYTLIPINRDTITDVYETDLFGNQRVVEKQIALSHAYESSEGLTNKGKCENTVKSASAILCGMRFHRYMSMTMDAVKIIVDSIGGVEVVLDEDYSEADPAFTKGASVLLDGDGAMRFVRMRGGLDDSTNIARMHRQELFLKAFFEEMGEADFSDEDLLELYEETQGFTYNSAGEDGYSQLFHKLANYEYKKTVTLEGESKIGVGGYMEFYVYKDYVEGVMVDVFYSKATE